MQSFQRYLQLSVLLLTVSAVSKPFPKTLTVDPVQAQSASPTIFPLPASLPNGAIVRIDGSSSMEIINATLKKRFAERFPGTSVDLAANGSDIAIKALLDGTVNMAAVGRPLTSQEKAQGLVLTPTSREKIAIIVGANNPFKGDLTFEQFAKMFRGEITDWSQVGGQPGKIRFVDRPETSDTRRSLSTYKVFQSAPFKNGATTTRVTRDDTASVIKELGTDGISYAIADQAIEQPDIRVLEMHGTLPSDPRYPYSQPRGYVYKQGVTDPATLAFLGFATSQPGQEIVQEAKQPEATTASPEATASPATPAPSPTTTANTALAPSTTATVATETNRGFPWWLLSIPLLGGLLWWLLKGRDGESAAPIATASSLPVAAPVASSNAGRIILTPRNCREGYAYWEVSDRAMAEARRQGGRDLKLRLFEVTDIPDMDRQAPHSFKDFDCKESDCDLHVSIPEDDRDYVVELGYLTADNRWLKIARSEHVRVPACPPVELHDDVKPGGAVVAGGAVAAGAAAAVAKFPAQIGTDSRIVLAARDSKDAYAYWEVPDAEKLAAKQEGGKKMMLRLYDVVSNINIDDQFPHNVQQFDVSETDQDKHLPIPISDRDYIAEVGYVTEEGHWLKLARSNSIRIPAAVALGGIGVAAGGTAFVGAGVITQPGKADNAAVATDSEIPVAQPVPATSGKCAIQQLTVHSRKNCFLFNADQMRQLENFISVPKSLESGSYIVRLKSGIFGYHSETETKGEPLVLLWIHGGQFINQKTNVPVNATWSTLNGYDETLCLEVLESATLHAFFLDTYADDNNTEAIVSVIKL